jgi:hypothetical protein
MDRPSLPPRDPENESFPVTFTTLDIMFFFELCYVRRTALRD